MLRAIWVVLLISNFAFGQVKKEKGDRYVLTVAELSAKKAYDGGKVFEEQIGDLLKEKYPSKLLDPRVSLQISNDGGTRLFVITWSCLLIQTKDKDADYYFLRRGTIQHGATLAAVELSVEEELRKSGKVKAMRKAFPGGRIPSSFIQDAHVGSETDGYWYVKEFFMVAPAPINAKRR